MKRTIRRLALVLALVLALSAAAMATELTYTEANAQGNVHAASLVDGCELKFDGDKLNVTYTDSKLKAGDTLPTRMVGAWIEHEFEVVYESRSGLIALLHRLEHRKPEAVARPGQTAGLHRRLRDAARRRCPTTRR